jgi:hypothetical protein
MGEHCPGPALVLVDRTGQLVGINDVATQLLDDDSPTQQALPHAVLTVAIRARFAASGADALPARARARTRSGRWIVLHGTRMGTTRKPRRRSSWNRLGRANSPSSWSPPTA